MSKIFYKYRCINDYTLDSIEKNYFYFSRPVCFNDLSDCFIPNDFTATPEDVLEWGAQFELDPLIVFFLFLNINILNKKSFLEKMEKAMEAYRNSCYIFCVSETFDNIDMWDAYGNSNSGICLGYESLLKCNNYLFEIDKEIINSFIVWDDNRPHAVLTKVDYGKKLLLPYNPFKHDIKPIREGFLGKDSKYSYENEYRSILVDYSNKNFDQKIPYKKNILKEIIFGANTNDNDINKVINIVSKTYDLKNINFFKINKIDTSMNLIRNEYKI
ncbi:MAG: DUF2971 domain-containing protein [Spirochaetaceae bacterium]|nr:DUF2971 domain-containing protein [Spirochaetaceae bacterium]